MKRLLGAAALATVIALSPACGRERPKATFNNRAPIVDTEKAVRMADDKPKEKELSQVVPTPVAPKKAEDAGVKEAKPAQGFQHLHLERPYAKRKVSEPMERIH